MGFRNSEERYCWGLRERTSSLLIHHWGTSHKIAILWLNKACHNKHTWRGGYKCNPPSPWVMSADLWNINNKGRDGFSGDSLALRSQTFTRSQRTEVKVHEKTQIFLVNFSTFSHSTELAPKTNRPLHQHRMHTHCNLYNLYYHSKKPELADRIC